ncbi:hypothetical protein CASFOL_010183 [Castilleja foliolosa]|uniref:Uncharacterized protein n=1 Tax=Castilleja foliolosa TaxID=1961234 RepID=A0ABD3DSD7_9LAMI
MAGEGEIQFAEPIIHRLQSFLTGKEAARTAVVSKSWHSAWLTRPNLDLDDTHFILRGRQYSNDYYCFVKFKKYAKKTIKRMGVTRLCLKINRSSFVLPNEVFGSDNLVELSSGGCSIKLDDGVIIKCRRLESLSLDDNMNCILIKIDTVSKIVSSCPSIEKLSLLSHVYQEYENRVDNVYVPVEERRRRFAAWEAAATAMTVGVVDKIIRLRCLVLGYESFETLCLDDLLSNSLTLRTSPYILTVVVKILVLFLEKGYNEGEKPRVKFDVPSVRKFTYEGAVIPCLSFISTPPSREWESNVSIKCNTKHGLSAFWFNELSELLTGLSQSKTHLPLHIDSNAVRFDYNVCKHELENLTIETKDLPVLSCYAFFDGLFRLCSPKLITQYYGNDSKLITQYYGNDSDRRQYNRPTNNIDFLCQILEQGVNFKVSSPTQFLYGLNDLEEVNAQAFDMDNVSAEWRPIPFDAHVQTHQRVRLLMKWKPS